jgi:hypothetical protein
MFKQSCLIPNSPVQPSKTPKPYQRFQTQQHLNQLIVACLEQVHEKSIKLLKQIKHKLVSRKYLKRQT